MTRARAASLFEREQFVPRPIEDTFAFFARAENLETLTPPLLRFHMITPTPIEMKRGTIVEYRLRISGIPVYWRTLIAEWDPPFRFVDVQQKGPYALWRHEHTFEPVEGGTLMRDRVEYRVPLGPIGRLAEKLFVLPRIRAIWDYRERRIAELLSVRSDG